MVNAITEENMVTYAQKDVELTEGFSRLVTTVYPHAQQFKSISTRTHKMIELICSELDIAPNVFIDYNKPRGVISFEVPEYLFDVSMLIEFDNITVEIPALDYCHTFTIRSDFKAIDLFYDFATRYHLMKLAPKGEVVSKMVDSMSKSFKLEGVVTTYNDIHNIIVISFNHKEFTITRQVNPTLDDVMDVLGQFCEIKKKI